MNLHHQCILLMVRNFVSLNPTPYPTNGTSDLKKRPVWLYYSCRHKALESCLSLTYVGAAAKDMPTPAHLASELSNSGILPLQTVWYQLGHTSCSSSLIHWLVAPAAVLWYECFSIAELKQIRYFTYCPAPGAIRSEERRVGKEWR